MSGHPVSRVAALFVSFLLFPLHDKHDLTHSLGPEDNRISAILFAAPHPFPPEGFLRRPHQPAFRLRRPHQPAFRLRFNLLSPHPGVIRLPAEGVSDFNGGFDCFFFYLFVSFFRVAGLV